MTKNEVGWKKLIARHTDKRSGRSLKRAGYTALVDRIEAAKNSAKVLCSEAHQADDQETEWMARACLKDLERTDARLKGNAV
jgi:hypothetical protein